MVKLSKLCLRVLHFVDAVPLSPEAGPKRALSHSSEKQEKTRAEMPAVARDTLVTATRLTFDS